MAFIGIRGSDDAVIYVAKNSKSPELPETEVEKTPPPKFKPSFLKIKWTYDSGTDKFTNTGNPMTW